MIGLLFSRWAPARSSAVCKKMGIQSWIWLTTQWCRYNKGALLDVEVCLAVRASMMIYAGRRGILGCKQGIYGRVSAGFAVSLEDLFLEVGHNSTNLDSLKTFDKDRLILVGPAKLSAKTCWVFIYYARVPSRNFILSASGKPVMLLSWKLVKLPSGKPAMLASLAPLILSGPPSMLPSENHLITAGKRFFYNQKNLEYYCQGNLSI